MRFISLFVAFCFSLNVMASTGTVQELERQLDDYHYSLSVEWDQEDQKFYETRTNEFFAKLKKLIMEEGLSQDQIMTLVEKKVHNKKVVEALKLKLGLMAGKSSPEELAKIIQDSSKDLYSQGASWNGQVVITVAIGLLVAAVVGYAIWWDANHECVAYESQYVCNTFSNCNYGGGYYGGGCYGGGYYTTCGNTDVCTQYARR
jgi:hypothetical protein